MRWGQGRAGRRSGGVGGAVLLYIGSDPPLDDTVSLNEPQLHNPHACNSF